MSRLRGFALFWWEFIIGDDWRIAAWVVAGLAATSMVSHEAHARAWWIMPVAVSVGLVASLWLAARDRGGPGAN